MALVKSLSNIQRMKRSVKLREDGLSDDEMVEIMEQMINTALVAQASGNKNMMKRSVEELRQVRKDVRTGNVKLSTGKQQKVIGRFSNLVDQLEGEQETNTTQSAGGSGLGGIMSSLPSAETLISAVMTANPLLGYSTKILKDIGGSVKNKTRNDQEAAKRQAQILEEQRDYVLDRKGELEMESEINEKQRDQLSDYDIILKNIESELIKLRQIWEGDDNQLVKESEDTNSKLGKLVEAEERIVEEQRLQREQSEFAAMESEREGGDDSVSDVFSKEEGGKGGFFGILGGLAAMMGGKIMGGLMAVFGIFKAIGSVGMALLKIGVKGSVIGAVIMSIYKFIEGFFNAGDILDMADADLNIKDRLIAGFANVWGSLIKLFDTVLEWFDIDIIDSDGITKRIAKSTKELVDNFFDWVFGLFDNVRTFIQDFDISETLGMVKDKSIELMQKLVNIIPEMVGDAFEKVGDLFSDAKDWMFGDDKEPETESQRLMKNFTPNFSYDGRNASNTMQDRMSRFEDSTHQGKSDGSANAVVAGNNNTTINNNKTEVQTIKNTSNLDESIRDNNMRTLDRLKFS